MTMEKSSDAIKAREALNGKAFDGRKIEVIFSLHTKVWVLVKRRQL